LEGEAQWQQSIVRILDSSETTRGAGFLLCGDRRLLVTCTHVVAFALGSIPSIDAPGPAVRFLNPPPGEALPTVVRAIDPKLDVCVLELAAGASGANRGLALELSRRVLQRAGSAVGFPNVDRPVIEDNAVVKAQIKVDGSQQILFQLESSLITPGFSGGPLVDNVTGRVLGVVAEILAQDKFGRLAKVAYAIPVDAIVSALGASTLVDRWRQELMTSPRIKELSRGFSTAYSRLESLSTKPDAIQGADLAFAHDTQDYFAGTLSPSQYQVRCQEGDADVDYGVLAQRLREGGLALFLGSRFFGELGLSLSEQTIAAAISRQLAGQDRGAVRALPAGSLPRASHYWELKQGRTTLRKELVRAVAAATQNQQVDVLETLAATLGRGAPLLTLTTFYDSLLEAALSRTHLKVKVVSQGLQNSEETPAPAPAKGEAYSGSLHVLTIDPPAPISRARIESASLSVTKPLENGYSLVYRICGGISFEEVMPTDGASDTLIVCEPDFFDLAQSANRALPDYVIRQLKNKNVVFMGCDLSKWHECMILRSLIKSLNGTKERLFAVPSTQDPYAKEFWRHAGVTQVDSDVSTFLQNLVSVAGAVAQ
jgi:S1-C subfamily serine protease